MSASPQDRTRLYQALAAVSVVIIAVSLWVIARRDDVRAGPSSPAIESVAPAPVETFAGTWIVSGELDTGHTFKDVAIVFKPDGTFIDGPDPGRWEQDGSTVKVTYESGVTVDIQIDGTSATGVITRTDGGGSWRMTRQ